MSEQIAYKYNKARNRDEAYHFPGVPLRDITEEEFKALPDWMQAQVKASKMYEPANAAPKKKASKKKATKKAVVAKPQEAPQAPVVAIEQPTEGEGVTHHGWS